MCVVASFFSLNIEKYLSLDSSARKRMQALKASNKIALATPSLGIESSDRFDKDIAKLN